MSSLIGVEGTALDRAMLSFVGVERSTDGQSHSDRATALHSELSVGGQPLATSPKRSSALYSGRPTRLFGV